MATLTGNITADQTEIPTDAVPGFYTVGSESIRVIGVVPPAVPLHGDPPTGRMFAIRGIAGTTKATHSSGATLTPYYPDAPGGTGSGGVTVLGDPGVAWQADHAYQVGDRFAEMIDGALRVFEITVAGTSGSGLFSDYGADLVPDPDVTWGSGGESWVYVGVVGKLPWSEVPFLGGGLATGPYNGSGHELTYTTTSAPEDSASAFGVRATVEGSPVSIFEFKTDGDADWFLDQNAGAGFRFNQSVDGVLAQAGVTQFTTDGFLVFSSANESFEVHYDPFYVRVVGLPTADPGAGHEGELWIDTAADRVLKVSAG